MNWFHKQLLFKLLIISLSALLIILQFEMFLRLIKYPYQNCPVVNEVIENKLAQFDSLLGWSYIPNKSTVAADGINYTFNAEGYRSINIKDQTDINKPVILLIGDSFLFGHGLRIEDTFGYKLEKSLNHKYQVLNFAVQGYGTDQMYLLLKKLFPKYQPQIVIMNYIGDHIRRNLNEDRRDIIPCAKFLGTKPLFKIENNQLQLKNKPKIYSQYDNPRIALLIRKLFSKITLGKIGSIGYQITDQLIESTKNYTKSNGSKFYLLTIDPTDDDNHKLNLKGQVLGTFITSIGQKEQIYHISSDNPHPNALATSKMVGEFLDKFGNEF